MLPIGMRRWQRPPMTPGSSLRLCRRRGLTSSGRVISTASPCGRRFAIFSTRRPWRARTCRRLSISPVAARNIMATTTSCRSTRINRDADVPIDALRISDFAHALAQTPGKARIIVLDAARANPYASQGSPLAPGLALVDPEPGELIAFNAAPGTLAGDEQGPYGVYAKTLAGAMRQGGVPLEDVFDQTRVTVNQQTAGALVPWSASKLAEPYFIFERVALAPPPPAAAPANQPIASLPAEAAYPAAL